MGRSLQAVDWRPVVQQPGDVAIPMAERSVTDRFRFRPTQASREPRPAIVRNPNVHLMASSLAVQSIETIEKLVRLHDQVVAALTFKTEQH